MDYSHGWLNSKFHSSQTDSGGQLSDRPMLRLQGWLQQMGQARQCTDKNSLGSIVLLCPADLCLTQTDTLWQTGSGPHRWVERSQVSTPRLHIPHADWRAVPEDRKRCTRPDGDGWWQQEEGGGNASKQENCICAIISLSTRPYFHTVAFRYWMARLLTGAKPQNKHTSHTHTQ